MTIKYSTLDFGKTSFDLEPPSYPGDCGYDLHVSEDIEIVPGANNVPTNLRIQLPPGTWGLITGRSSTYQKHNLIVVPGIIDHGYRGPIFAVVHNPTGFKMAIGAGERLAQLILMRLITYPVQKVGNVDASERGDAGFGSTNTEYRSGE